MADQPKKKFPKLSQRVYQTQSPRKWWRANSASNRLQTWLYIWVQRLSIWPGNISGISNRKFCLNGKRPENALDYSDSRLASTFATRLYMYAEVLMGLTVSCQKRSVIFHRQPSKMPTGINCQKVSRHFKSCFFLVFQLIFMDLWLLNNLQTGKPVPTFSKHSFKTFQHLSTCLYLKIFRNFTSKRPRQPPNHNC